MKAPHYKYTFFLQLLLCFFLLSVNSNCNRKQALTASSNKEKTTTNNPQVIYFIIESVIDSVTGNPTMKIIQQRLTNGNIDNWNEIELKSGNWQISLLNEKGKRIDSITLNDPHIQDVELPNDRNEFETRKIQLVQTEIPVRFNYSSSIREIEVVELLDDKKSKLLFRTRLIF